MPENKDRSDNDDQTIDPKRIFTPAEVYADIQTLRGIDLATREHLDDGGLIAYDVKSPKTP